MVLHHCRQWCIELEDTYGVKLKAGISISNSSAVITLFAWYPSSPAFECIMLHINWRLFHQVCQGLHGNTSLLIFSLWLQAMLL